MSGRAQPSAPPQTKLLSPGMQWLYRVSFVLCLCVAGVAAVGVFTIADAEERKYKLSHTQFARWFYSLVQFNQVGSAFSGLYHLNVLYLPPCSGAEGMAHPLLCRHLCRPRQA